MAVRQRMVEPSTPCRIPVPCGGSAFAVNREYRDARSALDNRAESFYSNESTQGGNACGRILRTDSIGDSLVVLKARDETRLND
jgi:hypothetical protein